MMPEMINAFKEMRRSQASAENLRSFAYDLTMDDMESIERYDQKHNFVSNTEMPLFKGDMMKDKDYRKYMMKLQEYEDECIKENYDGHMKTREEIREIELKKVLEENGWNIRNLYNNKDKEKKLKKAIKRDKQQIERKKINNEGNITPVDYYCCFAGCYGYSSDICNT